MKSHIRLMLLLIFALLMTGCAREWVMNTSGKNFPRTDPNAVKLYLTDKPAISFEGIGRVKVLSHKKLGFSRSGDAIYKIMRIKAASIGGDAIINITDDFESISGVVIKYSPAPTTDSSSANSIAPASYQDVQFAQLVQPTFAKDFAGKKVKFEASFLQIMNMTMDLPSNYKEYVRLNLCSPSGETANTGDISAPTCENAFWNVVIAKDKSGAVFNLKQGQKVKIAAYATQNATLSASGGSQSSLLLVIDSLEAE